MRVSTDLYLYHTSQLQLMWFFGPLPVKDCNFSFYFAFLTHSCLFNSPHLTWTTRPLSIKNYIFLACIWHINAPGPALTLHVVKFIHHNTHTCSPNLYPRATSVCMPLPHYLAGLCCDLSHTCIGMFESLLLLPYYIDDLWTSIHRPNMGHRSCIPSQLTTLEIHLSSFLTP